VEEEDQEIPGGETLLPRWRKRVIDGKIWNVWHKTEQGGGLSSVAYAPPRCNRRKQSKTLKLIICVPQIRQCFSSVMQWVMYAIAIICVCYLVRLCRG
jgi:hypothetical protein